MKAPIGLTHAFIFVLFALRGCACADVKCFRCFDVEDPKSCTQSAVCGKDEICYTKLFEDHAGKQRYHLGCEDKTVCTLLKSSNIVGRRDTASRKCFDCCSSNECNSLLCHDTVHTQVHKPTTTPKCGPDSGSGGDVFHDTCNIQWRDCSHGNSWITFNHLDLSPWPLKLPGDFNLTLDADIRHPFGNDVKVDILVEKELLGRYTKVPCHNEFGTCSYYDICHFLHYYTRFCHALFQPMGLPCTCPVSLQKINIKDAKVTIASINEWVKMVYSGHFHFKISLTEKSTGQERACLEAYTHLIT